MLIQAAWLGLGWYLTHLSTLNLMYGSLGALMAVLFWVYVSALRLMWGAQMSATFSRTYGSNARGPGAAKEMDTKPEPEKRLRLVKFLRRVAGRRAA